VKLKPTSYVVAVLIAVMCAMAAMPVSADGRELTGRFCTNPQAQPKPGACMSLSFDGQTATGYTNSPDRVLELRPGTYWLSVDDTSAAHNFALEDPSGAVDVITGVAGTPGWVTVKVNLTPGTWRLLCVPHDEFGMYVQIDVGGVGEVDR
jgi:plastocyanin